MSDDDQKIEPLHRPAPESNDGEAPEPAAHEPAAQEAGEDAPVDWERPETWPQEVGGQRGPEPTRYGDWESHGRCTDF